MELQIGKIVLINSANLKNKEEVFMNQVLTAKKSATGPGIIVAGLRGEVIKERSERLKIPEEEVIRRAEKLERMIKKVRSRGKEEKSTKSYEENTKPEYIF